MEKIKGQYIFDKGSWKVRYKVEDGDEQHYEQVMLHPNCQQYARKNQTDWFTIKHTPNLANEGIWEAMAIVVSSDKLEEVSQKIKGKELFRTLNKHAMSVLTETGLPELEDKSESQITPNIIKEKKVWNWNKIIDVILLFGIIFLAALDKDGWGWLLFIYMIKNV